MDAFAGMMSGWASRAAARKMSFYAWRDGLGLADRLGLALAAAAGIGISAQLSVPLPFTPVPLSLQTFAVASAAVALGWGWGVLSAALYVGLAALGVPWLAGFKGGLAAATGPTAGYLLGFVLLALALSLFARKPARCRWLSVWLALFISDALLLLLPGSFWLFVFLNSAGRSATLAEAFAKGFLPFVAVDLVKSGAASLLLAWLGRR
jgi:biotin transport system substrate-specific component